MKSMNLTYQVKILAVLLALTSVFVMSLFISTTEAQYTKNVIVITGQDAPDVAGGVFGTFPGPQGIAFSDGGKALILGGLVTGANGITADNDEGYWIFEGDSLRLLVREGGPIVGYPQGIIVRGRIPAVFMSPNGQLGMYATYSPDGAFDGSTNGLFAFENGAWALKMFEGMIIPSGDTLFAFTVQAFNEGRALFTGGIRGPTVLGSNDNIIAEFGPNGISVLIQSEHALPGVPGDWIVSRTSSKPILTSAGKTVFSIQAGSISSNDRIGVVYSWDPIEGHIPLRVSGIDSTFVVFGSYSLNTTGNNVNKSWQVFGIDYGLFDSDYNLIVTEGDLADGSDGATFSNFNRFAIFDNDEIVFQAATSDGKLGIWGTDSFGLRKIARVGDAVPLNPNRPGDYRFWRVNNMELNRRGQVAFSDLVVESVIDSAYVGVWLGSIDEPLQLVIESDERVEVLADSFLTIESAFIINASIPRTGADGFHSGLNNNGEILLSISFNEGFSSGASGLLIARPGGLIVNTTTDAPDADTTDGICDTGNKLPDGRTECSLRAALMEANSDLGLDTIRFSILGAGIPVIKPTSVLPTITDPVVIDGTTQIDGLVELNGATSVVTSGTARVGVDGLTIATDGATLSGLIINGFSGNGVTLQGGSGHAIQKCIIGTNKDDDPNLGNVGHGIFISGSVGALIGGPDPEKLNTIAFNKRSGIFVESGDENQFTQNRIFSNGELGIDLAPVGVNPNDSGDSDGGPNGLQNYPVLDSVDVDIVTTIWGRIDGRIGESYQIDVYLSDSCDTTGFGEGKKLIESVQVSATVTGSTPFAIGTSTAPERGQYLSATATDAGGNTSEFSRCISASFHLLVDVNDKPIVEKKFAVFKVKNDRPTFTETFVDSVTTDKFGVADLTKYKIPDGDSLRFSRRLDSRDSPKRATSPKVAYSTMLDNAQFDSASSVMSYSVASNGMFREKDKVKMTHTTVAYNLYVSIQFDATVAYVNSLQNAFRLASDYLYDVTDGQARLDTIVITDDALGWNIADIWVFASNMEWPRATANGLLLAGGRGKFYMPRKFYGNKTANRNLSANENPLNTATPSSYRTFIHELGHYAFGFYDEYVFPDSAGKCGFVEEYGFMALQYAGTKFRSEMSHEDTYGWPDCDNTAQFVENGNSCWETFQGKIEKVYDGILAPIVMPTERELPGGREFLLGPNDDLSSLDVNVGAKMVFPIAPSAPAIPPRRFRFFNEGGVTPMGNIEVQQIINSSGRGVNQGFTSDDGHIYFMGASSAYGYWAEGFADRRAASGSRSSGFGDFSWSYGQGALPDTGAIMLAQVQGELPLIPSVSLSASGIQYSLRPLNQFVSVPSVVSDIGEQRIDSAEFALSGGEYQVTIADTSASEFRFTVYAPDMASEMYFFSSRVSVSSLGSSGAIGNSVGQSADFSLILDASSVAEKKIVLATSYPPIRSGLSPNQIQAGKVGVVQTFPASAGLVGVNTLQIRYAEGSAESNGIDSSLEMTLRVHHWDDAGAQWTLVGGTVDTANNEVSVKIAELGTYALFTTDIQTDVGDGEHGEAGVTLPKQFVVNQNHPNPFNPTTEISYSLPIKAEVTIAIYNVLGQRVKFFEQGEQSAGAYSVTWDATDERGKSVASGVYFYKVSAGEFSASRKMVLMK